MLIIRRCSEADTRAARDLITEILAKEFPNSLPAFPTEDLEDIASSYGSVGEAFFVALMNGKIVGTVGVKQEDRRTALLRRLYVHSTYRRKKIGSQLVDQAIEFCRDVGYDELIFRTTSAMNLAVRLCKKKGFISRAKLDLGPIQLMKFALFLKSQVAVA